MHGLASVESAKSYSAVKALEKGSFDAAILDIRMPGLNGIEVLEQLKQISPETEAIVMTGGPRQLIRAADRRGASSRIDQGSRQEPAAGGRSGSKNWP